MTSTSTPARSQGEQLLSPGPPEPGIQNVGPREPLSSLIEDFKFNSSFCAKVNQLVEHGYVGWRRVRGDGNCFYRAVLFGLLERLVTTTEQKRLQWIGTFQDNLKSLVFEDNAEMAAHEDLIYHIELLRTSGGWEVPPQGASETTALGLLYQSLRDPTGTLDLALIRAARRMSAGYLLANKHNTEIAGGITFDTVCSAQGYNGVEDFCEQVIFPMGVEAEGVALGALPPVIGARLRIAFLDRTDNTLAFCDYSTEGAVEQEVGPRGPEEPLVHLQLRPGHYDLVYFRDEEDDMHSVSRLPTFGFDDGLEYLLEEPPPAHGQGPAEAGRRPRARTPRRGCCT